MIELAKQELKILEAQHPTRFQFLKLQLKEFIHLLTHDEHQQHSFHQQFHSSIITQESSNSSSKKRERKGENKKDGHNNINRYSKTKCRIKKRKTEESDAIQKAEACLRKIQNLKSFFCSSNH